MACGIHGCAGPSAKYGSVEAEEGGRRLTTLCWSHYMTLVQKESSKRAPDLTTMKLVVA